MRFPTDSTDTRFSIPFGSPDPAARFKKHAGVDINVPTGTNVYAPVSGLVTAYTSGPYHGNVIEIRGDDGLYYHMLHNSKLLVNPGSRVFEGNLVAKSGSTGSGVTGPHVHFGIAKKSLPNVTSFSDFIDPNSVKGDDMYEGKTAREWAIQAKDAEKWKQAVVKSKAFDRGINKDISNVTFIIDDLQDFKDRTINNPPGFEKIGEINGQEIFKKKG